jgi:diacylglycerol kinase (ATP)
LKTVLLQIKMEPATKKVKKILFIVNPISGSGKNSPLEKYIEERFGNPAFTYKIVQTERAGHASELSKTAVAEGTDIIVAVGGDGTVNETARAIIGTDCAMGIIPTGSGNGLARHLKLPFNVKKALASIALGRFIMIDTATLDDKVFLSMAGIGYDAHVARKFADAGKRGFLTYFKIVSSDYRNYKPRNYRLILDGKMIKRKAFMVSFANSNQFGNNTSINPNAKLDDGYIDVCIVRKVPMRRLPFVIPLLFMGKFDKTLYIEIIRAKTITIKRKKGKAVHLDGDPYDSGKQMEIQIHPLSLRIIVP